MPIASVLLDRLHRAGLADVTAVEPVEGGLAALAGIATRRGGPPLFVKSFVDVPADDLFAAEAEGLDVLRERGALATPQVVLATRGRARMPFVQLRQHLAVIAQFDHDWGAAQQVRAILKPFRR